MSRFGFPTVGIDRALLADTLAAPGATLATVLATVERDFLQG